MNWQRTPGSNLSFLSPEAFGSWVSPCLRSRRKRLNSLNSACPCRPEYADPAIRVVRRLRAAGSNAGPDHPVRGRQNDALRCGVPFEVDLKGRTHILALRG